MRAEITQTIYTLEVELTESERIYLVEILKGMPDPEAYDHPRQKLRQQLLIALGERN
jgi:hypothetical protein